MLTEGSRRSSGRDISQTICTVQRLRNG